MASLKNKILILPPETRWVALANNSIAVCLRYQSKNHNHVSTRQAFMFPLGSYRRKADITGQKALNKWLWEKDCRARLCGTDVGRLPRGLCGDAVFPLLDQHKCFSTLSGFFILTPTYLFLFFRPDHFHYLLSFLVLLPRFEVLHSEWAPPNKARE
jgi:hypothetical protein